MAKQSRRRIDLPRPTTLYSAAHKYKVAYVEDGKIFEPGSRTMVGFTDERYQFVYDTDERVVGSRAVYHLLDAQNASLAFVRLQKHVIVLPNMKPALFTYQGDWRAAAVATILILSKICAELDELLTD